MDIQQQVRQFIIENFYVSDASVLTDEASLIASGVIDSTGILEVITFLEDEYQITIGDTEITPDNLETIAQISRFVVQKQSAATV